MEFPTLELEIPTLELEIPTLLSAGLDVLPDFSSDILYVLSIEKRTRMRLGSGARGTPEGTLISRISDVNY